MFLNRKNMSVKLVTYDLNKPGQNYEGLLKQIKQFAWARLSESSYAVETDLTPKALYDLLSPYLDASDTLLVITLTAPYYGRASKEVIDWLERRLASVPSWQ